MQGETRKTLDLPVAGAWLGIPRSTSYRLAAAGTFPVPVIRAGRRLFVPLAPLEKLLTGDPPKATESVGTAATERSQAA